MTIANAVGNGVADDKLIYTYLPDLIRYYLAEEPVLANVDTWRLGDADAPRGGAGPPRRAGAQAGRRLRRQGHRDRPGARRRPSSTCCARKVLADPRSWIAQPVVQLSTVPTLFDGRMRPRHVDLRPFAVNDGHKVWVLPGGLTRVALAEGELIVNSSRGGGSKDTWVLAGGRRGRARPARRARAARCTRPPLRHRPGDRRSPASMQAEQQQQTTAEEAPVLSRIAESLFWIGRYVERAEDTARILDVQTQMMVEDPAVDIDTACRTPARRSWAPRSPRTRLDPARRRCYRLAFDTDEGTSISSAIGGARESARRARETLSTDAVGGHQLDLPHHPVGPVPRDAHARTRSGGCASGPRVINGTADATMSRDEGWQFLVLGRSLERADMTARLVATSALSPGPNSAWATTLRACGAYQSFLRTYRGLETDREAAEYLLLDRLFPRSVVHALTRAEQCLANLEASGQRVGFQDEAQRLLGRARAELEYRSHRATSSTDLPGEMERLQRTCAAASDAVTHRYFAHAVAMSWQGGAAR